MSLFSRQQRREVTLDSLGVPGRSGTRTGAVSVTTDTAMRHSAVWACLRLRANLISTMPMDVFRKVGDIQVEMPKPPVLVNPGGERVGMIEWLYSSQVDLDRTGNAIGLITARNGAGLPAQIDLQDIGSCSVTQRDDQVIYRVRGKEYPPEQVWHERQYTVSGLPVGLSPVAYAAWTIGQYQSAQQFALDWYGSGAVPKGHLRNSIAATISTKDAALAKARFKTAVEGGDLFVTGKDWEYKPLQAEAVGAEWLEAQKYGIGDIARFFDCPGDLIDAVVSTGHITYASITQRNLQFLIMHLGPVVVRRENRLAEWLPKPRFVKLNTSALLRMDDETRAKVIQTQIRSRTLAPSEARALENRPPLTSTQIEEFTVLFGAPRTQASVTALSHGEPGP